MKKIISVILTALILLTCGVNTSYAQNDKPTSLHARAAALIDADSKRLLFGKDENTAYPMASTTKIMTLIIALENSDEAAVVTISKYAASQPDVQLNACAGEQYLMKDLLYVMMMQSFNDVAVAIAEYVGELSTGKLPDHAEVASRTVEESKEYVKAFANLMNQKAKKLSCYNTYFITPNGLDAEDENGVHSTTAYEMALIAAYAISLDRVIEICTTRSYTITEVSGKRTRTVGNTDRFLDMVNGAVGLKTGFTGEAGYCFVGAVKQDGRSFVSVVFASGWPPNKNYKWSDTKKLMNYALSNYFPETVFEECDSYKKIKVNGGTEEYVDTYIPFNINYPICTEDEVKVTYVLKDVLNAPVKNNSQVGTVYIKINGETVRTLPVLAKKNVEKKGFLWFLKKVLKIYFL